MKWLAYYGVTIVICACCGIYFNEFLNITCYSLVPVVLIMLMAIQAGYCYSIRTKEDFHSSSMSEFKESEVIELSVYMTNSFSLFIPPLIPFVLFFSNAAKVFPALLIYFVSLIAGIIFFRIHNRKRFKDKFLRERKELEEQLKKEELGKW